VTIHADRSEPTPARRRRLIGLGLLQALATTVVLVALYYLLPLDHVKNVPATLAAGLAILVAVTLVLLRVLVKSRYPAVRAVEALAATLPPFLLLFASAYVTMANANPANFTTHPLTRTDALYFTVTVFSTVEFGDITAQPVRPAGGHRANAARPARPRPGRASVRGSRAARQTASRPRHRPGRSPGAGTTPGRRHKVRCSARPPHDRSC